MQANRALTTQAANLTLREAQASKPNEAETTLVETAGSGETGCALLLGPEVEVGGWQLREAIKVTSGEADLWVASGKQDGQTAVVKVFRWGLRPKAEIEAKLLKVARGRVLEVYGWGVLPDGKHYEILEHICGCRRHCRVGCRSGHRCDANGPLPVGTRQ